MLGGNRSASGIKIPYKASEQSCLVLALFKNALLLLLLLLLLLYIISEFNGITLLNYPQRSFLDC